MGFDREAAISWYRRNRARSQALFDLLTDDAYYSQPIALRHPIVFYAGHLPAFSFNTLARRALGGASIDERLETLFARGIDPDTDTAPPLPETPVAPPPSQGFGEPRRSSPDQPASGGGEFSPAPGSRAQDVWPSRDEVGRFTDEADRRVLDALANADLDVPGHPLLDRAEAVFAILEHEAMHQETLLYMWHRLPFDQKRRPAGYMPMAAGRPPSTDWVSVPAGRATLGVDRGAVPFGWDNEFPSCSVEVPAFAIERHDVTNARFLEFVEAGGYVTEAWWTPEDWKWVREHSVRHPLFWEREGDRWYWRTMFERLPLPMSWPVYVSQAEASAYARWKGARLPSEAEYQRAAVGSPSGECRYPWGNFPPQEAHGVFDFSSWDPEPAGTHPRGASAWGIEDLVGNGWEWTSTVFAPFSGFHAMASYPEYSADFFDGQHFVMKGASPATSRELIRPTFRNWFRAHYPYVYAAFRCAKSAS
jgi:iron(II)-dependent oxidoreductase